MELQMNFSDFLPAEKIQEIRRQIYSPEGNGYFIFRNFLTPEQIQIVVKFWTSYEHLGIPAVPLVNKRAIYRGCPNHQNGLTERNKVFRNYFWNSPLEVLTHSISFQVQMLRNFIADRPLYSEFAPVEPLHRSACYRVVISKQGPNVAPHRDWFGGPLHDPSRLQATLFLTKKGVDYSGKGFMLRNNQDKTIEFDSSELEINPGDLVIWKYNNEHSVQDVTATDEQKGFIRIIYPPEYVHLDKLTLTFKDKLVLKKKALANALARRKLLLPFSASIKKLIK